MSLEEKPQNVPNFPDDPIISHLLYRDGLMLVINKPAGLPVHPGPKGGDTLFHHLDALRFGLPRKPEVAHRLDKDTSGCLILGRHPKALRRLGKLFHDDRIGKLYWAMIEGSPQEEQGLIDLPLAPKSPDRGWWMKVDAAGQPSQTVWRVLARKVDANGNPLTFMELKPITGRTHQLRAHCSAMGWPIFGDPIYGTAPRFDGPGLHLHARSITIPLYPNKPAITVEAPLPDHMNATLESLAITLSS